MAKNPNIRSIMFWEKRMVNSRLEILIVDDEPAICDLLCSELTERNYQCTVVRNGIDALNQMEMRNFGVILLDIRLPGLSGMDVLRQMQMDIRNTIIIMMTAVNDIGSTVEAVKLGASDYIIKPFDVDKINTRICVALKTRQRLPEEDSQDFAFPYKPEEKYKKSAQSFSKMNAIAFGLEEKYGLHTYFRDMVTEATVDIAHQLGLPRSEIQRWVSVRQWLGAEKKGKIEYSLNKLKGNAIAQTILGMTEPHCYRPKQSKSPN